MTTPTQSLPAVSTVVEFLTFKRGYLAALAATIAGCYVGRAPLIRYFVGSFILAVIADLLDLISSGLFSPLLPQSLATCLGVARCIFPPSGWAAMACPYPIPMPRSTSGAL